MEKTLRITFIILLSLGVKAQLLASHVMGGEITWRCGNNGGYVFELIFYRDCNGAEVNVITEDLRVWNHPTLTNITLNFISRTDISPSCQSVSGGPQPLDCGSGSGGGNGLGAIEKVIYRSTELQLSGTPPPQGWIFTYENFARSNAITNLSNPSTYGITLSATMYAVGPNSGCFDNAPQFLQAPYFVSCVGDPFEYNMNAIDPDFDSLFIEFASPLNHFPQGVFNPPINPAPIPFDPGFSFSSPTPNNTISPGSISAQLNAQNGLLSFTSTLQGNFVVKIQVSSFRQGQLIAKVEREMQLIVVPCQPNNAPVFTPPFSGGSFITNVDAGTLVNFNVLASDNGFLQNGTPQSVTLSATGPMFGTNFTAATGCDIQPCAFTSGIPTTGIGQANVPFTWQTDCNHLTNSFGIVAESVPYYFVFKAQDNVCQVPRISYATIQINVLNPGIISAPSLQCISFANGVYTLGWNAVSDPQNSFVSYQLYSLQNGLLATLNAINSTSFSIPSNQANQDFYLGVVSGCNGSITKFSDTLRPIVLQLTNPGNGTAILQWNAPTSSNLGGYYYIHQQINNGAWVLYDSVPYGTTYYKDTVRLCDGLLGYQITYPKGSCVFESNTPSGAFEDMLTPSIPVIEGVGYDPYTGNIVLTWNQNNQPDTYGYVIYMVGPGGALVEIDTVWGIGNTTYTMAPIPGSTNQFSVAAFDSCLTTSVPITYQTSGKSPIHQLVYLNGVVNACNQSVYLDWSPYQGWSGVNFDVFLFENGQLTLVFTSTGAGSEDWFTTLNMPGGNTYTFYVQANLSNGNSVYSNPFTVTVPLPGTPAFHYLQAASVNGSTVDIRVYVDQNAGTNLVQIEREETPGNFAVIGTATVVNDLAQYTDLQVDVQNQTHRYRSKYIDTCGNLGSPSNTATTVLASGIADNETQINVISWTPYLGFEVGVDHYEVFRIEPDGSAALIQSVPNGQLRVEDSVDSGPFPGKICYYVEAHEFMNNYGIQEICASNTFCLTYDPIIYIPNSIIPDGINSVFKPVATNIDPTKFKMTIMNRWSNVVFETLDFNEGWNGKYKDKDELVPNDMYIYVMEFYDAGGNQFIKRGEVFVIR
jgi:hypothetical protein